MTDFITHCRSAAAAALLHRCVIRSDTGGHNSITIGLRRSSSYGTPMGSLLGIVIAGWIFSVLYRRQQSRPAAALSDGSGHLLRHAPWERSITWLVLGAALVPAGLALYVLWRPSASRHPNTTLPLLLLCSAVFLLLTVWCFRSTRRHIRVNDAGVTLYRGRSAIDIAWASVTRVTTDLTGSLLICSSTGAEIAVNKMLVGIPTLVDYMRRHLPEQLYSAAFVYYTPRAHLGPSAP